MTPNDLKLSDGGAWRGSCEGGAQKEATDVGQRHARTRRVQARIAATVTRGAVRCSAWLAVAALFDWFIECGSQKSGCDGGVAEILRSLGVSCSVNARRISIGVPPRSPVPIKSQSSPVMMSREGFAAITYWLQVT